MEDYEESLWVPPSNSLWSAEAGFDAMEIIIDADTMQAQIGLDEAPGATSHVRDNFMASGSTVWGNTDASVPRGSAALEQILALGIPLTHLAERNVELLPPRGSTVHIEEVQEVEGEYTTSQRHSGSKGLVSNTSGYGTDEWEAQKPEIHSLYMEQDLPLSTVMAEMSKNGFDAKQHAYKRRFKKWGWQKNIKNYARPDGEVSIPDPSASEAFRRRNSASTSTMCEETLIPSSSCGSTVAAGSPIHFGLGRPRAIQQTQLDKHAHAIFFHVRSLYMGSIDQGRWKITNRCKVQEDIHDDLIAGVGIALRNFESLGPNIGGMGILKAFKTLENVVADCGLFSLPAIWISHLPMIQKGHTQFAKEFLSHALRLSIQKFHYGRNHPFVQVIVGLLKIEETEPHMLEQVIFRAYRSCIGHVTEKLSSFHLTTLSLWSDFVAYLDSSSASETKEAVDTFRRVIRRSEEDNGLDDDYTLELLGLKLYVLQSTESMAEEAELLALDMLCRVNRRLQAGEELEGSLFILWKDLRHVLGQFCRAKGDLHMAVMHLEDYLSHGVVDDRDIFALEHLEECYAQLGEQDEARRVRLWRMNRSRILLQEDDIELVEGETVDNEDEEGHEHDDIDEDIYEDEKIDGEAIEHDDAAELEDAEVEMQILQGQMDMLKKRMTIFQRKMEGNKGKKTTSSME